MCLAKMWPRYLLWFAHDLVDFRYSEINSITSMYNITMRFIEEPSPNKPYWVVELPSENCMRKIASRSVSLKNCIELWSRAKSTTQLHSNLRKSIENKSDKWLIINDSMKTENEICPSKLIDDCCRKCYSYKIDVETFCKHFSLKEKVQKIEEFAYLPVQGPVKLKNPDFTLSYLEFYGDDPNNVPELPFDVFFGRWITDGQRDLIQHYSLKRRDFIGNTSMDPQLSLLMANQGKVTPGDLVLDPFVGSGSLAVAVGHFGGYVWGTDIDFMMLHARTKPSRVGQKVRKREESIKNMMRQYGLENKYLDVVVSDFSQPLWRDGTKFDAIITDPPYGVREPTERIGIDRDNYTLTEEQMLNHIPAKVEYGLSSLYRDLMTFAARSLTMDGRLVCWYPIVRNEYSPSQLPSHPCLRLISNSEQVLSKLTARRLLTFEKVADDVLHLPEDPDAFVHNFREKYFAASESSRRERKERRAAQIAHTDSYLAMKNDNNRCKLK